MSEPFLYRSSQEQARDLRLAGRPLSDLLIEIRDLYFEDDRPLGDWI